MKESFDWLKLDEDAPDTYICSRKMWIKMVYSSTRLGTLYVVLRRKYFPQYINTAFNSLDFEELSKYLEKEQITPESYFDFVFGILDTDRPLKPKSLTNPLLVQRYRQMYER